MFIPFHALFSILPSCFFSSRWRKPLVDQCGVGYQAETVVCRLLLVSKNWPCWYDMRQYQAHMRTCMVGTWCNIIVITCSLVGTWRHLSLIPRIYWPQYRSVYLSHTQSSLGPRLKPGPGGYKKFSKRDSIPYQITCWYDFFSFF
jgi:hypothetical protein